MMSLNAISRWCGPSDLSLLEKRVRATRRAELPEGELVGRLLLVLGARVVLPLAGVAYEADQIAHRLLTLAVRSRRRARRRSPSP